MSSIMKRVALFVGGHVVVLGLVGMLAVTAGPVRQLPADTSITTGSVTR